MEISTKGRYALRFMVVLAKSKDSVSIAEVAASERISVKYLEKIAGALSKAGLVLASRGASGGYRLAKPAKECTVREILSATGDVASKSICALGCDRAKMCDTAGVWNALSDTINEFLDSVSLEDVVNKTYKK